MSMAFVHAVAKEGDGTFTHLAFNSFDLSVTSGDQVFLAVAMPATSNLVTSVVSNNGNTGTWTLLGTEAGVDTTAGSLAIYTAACTGSGFVDISVNVSSGGASGVLAEFSGITSPVADGTGGFTSNNGGGVGTTTVLVTALSLTTVNATDLWFTGHSTNDGPGTFSAMNISSPNNAWTLAAQTSGGTSGMPMCSAYKIVSSTVTGAQMGGANSTNGVAHYSGAIVAVKQGTVPPTSHNQLMMAL